MQLCTDGLGSFVDDSQPQPIWCHFGAIEATSIVADPQHNFLCLMTPHFERQGSALQAHCHLLCVRVFHHIVQRLLSDAVQGNVDVIGDHARAVNVDAYW